MNIPWSILFVLVLSVAVLWFLKDKAIPNPLYRSQKPPHNPNHHRNPTPPTSTLLVVSQSEFQKLLPPNVDPARISGDRKAPLDPAMPYPPTVAPSGASQKPPHIAGVPAQKVLPQPNAHGLSQLGPVKIPTDYLPLPQQPDLKNYNTPNFAPEGLRVDAFFKKQPLAMDGGIPLPEVVLPCGTKRPAMVLPSRRTNLTANERGMKAGSLSSAQYQPNHWMYEGEKIQNGGSWGGIVAYEPTAVPDAVYSNPRLTPAEHGYYPNENPNTNNLGIPALPAHKDDLRMGLGIPAYQGAFVNERVPM